MSGRADGQSGGWFVRCAAVIVAAVLLTAVPPVRLSAQVGYDPAHSPYHDMPRGAVWALSVGHLGGSRGEVGVGPADGLTGALRYEVPFGAVGASLGLAYARTSRFVEDYTKDSTSRRTGPFNDPVVLADAGLQLVLTGRKTWHRFAPFIGGALGVAIGSRLAQDTSGYRFGTKITLAPNAGVRWYPTRRVSVRGDFRLLLWKLHYPLSYKVPNKFDNSTVLPATAALDQWTAHPWATIGVGWIF
jgi:hypothetical protein